MGWKMRSTCNLNGDKVSEKHKNDNDIGTGIEERNFKLNTKNALTHTHRDRDERKIIMVTSQNAWFKSKAEHDCHYYHFNELYSFRTIKTFSCDKICSGCISHMFASPIFTRHYYFMFSVFLCVYYVWHVGNTPTER